MSPPAWLVPELYNCKYNANIRNNRERESGAKKPRDGHRYVFCGLLWRLNRFLPLDLFGVEISQACSAEGANQPQSQGDEACDYVD